MQEAYAATLQGRHMAVYSFYIFDRHGKVLSLLPKKSLRNVHKTTSVLLAVWCSRVALINGLPALITFSFSLAECIYKKKFYPPGTQTGPPNIGSRSASSSGAKPANAAEKAVGGPIPGRQPRILSAEDDAKLVFGTIFSLRNMV